MAKTRCCRFHKVFIALLVLSVFSFAGHFVLDIVHPPHQQSVTSQWQSSGDTSFNGPDVGHATSLHGSFILTEMPTLGQASPGLVPIDLSLMVGAPWQPPAPLRPPISL